MGYHDGPLDLSAARDLARNAQARTDAKAALTKGWCDVCAKLLRIDTTGGTARYVHADGTPPCPALAACGQQCDCHAILLPGAHCSACDPDDVHDSVAGE